VNYAVATYSHAGDLFGRLMRLESIEFVGVMPATRAELWKSAFNRMMDHPFIGHGPHYVIERGVGFWYWPHNGYLYIGHMVGLIGLTFYLAILYRLWRMSSIGRQSLTGTSYARAFLVVANTQLLVFIVDQLKIDYARNAIYTTVVWLMFANIVAAYQIVRREESAERPASP
jgi:O-antigen ligase